MGQVCAAQQETIIPPKLLVCTCCPSVLSGSVFNFPGFAQFVRESQNGALSVCVCLDASRRDLWVSSNHTIPVHPMSTMRMALRAERELRLLQPPSTPETGSDPVARSGQIRKDVTSTDMDGLRVNRPLTAGKPAVGR